MKLVFLGTGTSTGVPQIGCGCKTCTSGDPRDRRRRCGAYVSTASSAVLVDTPPELRLSLVEKGIGKVDAVLLTHAHMDHVAAFDDIRRFNTINGKRVECDPSSPGANGRTWRIEGKILECYAMPETEAQMRSIFPYISDKAGENGLYRPQILFKDNTVPFAVGDIEIRSFKVEHGFPCCGYVLKQRGSGIERAAAYASDCHSILRESLDAIRGVGVLVLDCLRLRPHPTHMNLEAALACIREVSPRRAFLTHFCHDLTHEEWLERLPEGVSPAFDGLEVDL